LCKGKTWLANNTAYAFYRINQFLLLADKIDKELPETSNVQ